MVFLADPATDRLRGSVGGLWRPAPDTAHAVDGGPQLAVQLRIFKTVLLIAHVKLGVLSKPKLFHTTDPNPRTKPFEQDIWTRKPSAKMQPRKNYDTLATFIVGS